MELKHDGFPDRLRGLRERRGISRRTLSELCGLPHDTIRRFERGEMLPSLDAAAEIANFFDVSLDWLAGRTHK